MQQRQFCVNVERDKDQRLEDWTDLLDDNLHCHLECGEEVEGSICRGYCSPEAAVMALFGLICIYWQEIVGI